MVRRKVVWSPEAKMDLFEIMEFYRKRNGSSNYSKKIYFKIRKSTSILKRFSGIGAKTDIENVKCLIVEKFCIFYRIDAKSVEIFKVWDSQRNPDDLNLK